jgi:hypothetical protein
MALLTTDQLRQHLETGLEDAALQRLLDAEEAEIIRRYGPHASATELHAPDSEWMFLRREPSSIDTVTETVGDEDTVLSSDDYRDWGAGRLERLDDGTNPRSSWGDRVEVQYTPVDRQDERTMALINLCKLAAEYNALEDISVGGGDYRASSLEYNRERERLLGSLAPRGVSFA